MSDAWSGAGNRDNFCYRHPDRQSFILCQRCGRTIYPECQTQAPVGVHCPECMKQSRASAPRVRRPSVISRSTYSRFDGQPVVTYAMVGITVVLSLLALVIPAVTSLLLFSPLYMVPGALEPWRLFTSFLFLPLSLGSPLGLISLAFTGFTIFIFGRILEPTVGRWQFLAIYVLSGVGGNVAFSFLTGITSATAGTSGVIFGLIATFFIVQRRSGGSTTPLLILVGLNLLIGFLPGFGIPWQQYLGGAIAGGLAAFIVLRTGAIRQRRQQMVLLIAEGIVLVVLAVLKGILAF